VGIDFVAELGGEEHEGEGFLRDGRTGWC
jgi:hypothetical protein